jgi:periplasmic protein TonB
MLGYIEGRPAIAARGSSPNVLLVIIAVHVALIALVMSAKMDVAGRIKEGPLIVDLIPEPTPPPPVPHDPQVPHQPVRQVITDTPQIVPVPPTSSETIDSMPTPGAEVVGEATEPQPHVDPLPIPPAVVKTTAQLLTSAADLKPPYPPSKLLTEEEADLRLRLTIDVSGRVVAVDPIGRADPAFLNAARRHLIARWRFRPASEDGRAVASTKEITLRFRLD